MGGERVQRPPLQGLGDDRHRHQRPAPADPSADLPAGPVHVLPMLGAAGPAGHRDLLHHHRRPPLASRGNVQDRKGRVRLRPEPGPHLGRDLAGSPPCQLSPSCGPPPSAARCPAASPSRPPATALTTPTPPRPTAPADTLTSRYPSRTLPS